MTSTRVASYQEATDFILQALSSVASRAPSVHIHPARYDLHLDAALSAYLRATGQRKEDPGTLGFDNHIEPFRDAAWTLCVSGVIRPGYRGTHNISMANREHLYCLTLEGRRQLLELQELSLTPSLGPALITELETHDETLGTAFVLRAKDAALAYAGRAYFASCAMCGAATEAAFLAVVAESKGVAQRDKLAQRGKRSTLVDTVLQIVPKRIRRTVQSQADSIIHWRDEAMHRTSTEFNIGTAHAELAGLRSLALALRSEWSNLSRDV